MIKRSILLTAVPLLFWYPITRASHAEVRKQLAAAEAAATD